ncbi:MAG TPA: hypothetical protein VGN18_09510 [Jatrophihabitans sp.]|jgi:hypothetical protein|uniref:hypothetical protein n=1 Tax=Jatrophihabitans sp. TaxID=1932789 RepID=UPI002E00F733|nr:hypothetical protein [Jatrophihabitans sp.]
MILKATAAVVAAFLVIRGIAECFVIDFGDPSTYRNDRGGPSTAGVLARHCGPAILIAAYLLTSHLTKGGSR